MIDTILALDAYAQLVLIITAALLLMVWVAGAALVINPGPGTGLYPMTKRQRAHARKEVMTYVLIATVCIPPAMAFAGAFGRALAIH